MLRPWPAEAASAAAVSAAAHRRRRIALNLYFLPPLRSTWAAHAAAVGMSPCQPCPGRSRLLHMGWRGVAAAMVACAPSPAAAAAAMAACSPSPVATTATAAATVTVAATTAAFGRRQCRCHGGPRRLCGRRLRQHRPGRKRNTGRRRKPGPRRCCRDRARCRRRLHHSRLRRRSRGRRRLVRLPSAPTQPRPPPPRPTPPSPQQQTAAATWSTRWPPQVGRRTGGGARGVARKEAGGGEAYVLTTT